ncbi:2-acyl-glycerophospho-ethanolamine acyltransferase [Metabacillus sp. 84]|uniref:2-acyl-glycerophospho-ethanolamine acyltransferase n=1 Tax=Metabacillus sp. 84 TaxID=3404705 RepID=UPI003CF8A9AE
MTRKNLRGFTTISFGIALCVIILLPVSVCTAFMAIDKPAERFIQTLAAFTFFLSIVGIPLSITSMFSKESPVKRVFALIVNLSPLCLLLFGLIAEFADEFLRTAP